VSFIKNLMNFHPTDTTPFRRQAWSRPEFGFDCEPGTLSFWWHSLAGAEVDIFVDGIAVEEHAHVSPNWALHTVLVLDTGSPHRRVRLAVNAEQLKVDGDSRELAIALGAFSLKRPTCGI
jgi:hypothetical protein